jgi:dienelactone hydrolase
LDTHKIRYRDDGTLLTGMLVSNRPPDGSSQRGIMVIHGGAGLDAHAEERARMFASLGYAVFACDMYGDGVAGNRDRILSCIHELRTDRERLCRRARAGLDVLAEQPFVEPRVAVVGYCFGGLVALELARAGLDLAAVVSVHGSLTTKAPASPRDVTSPILVCHGALDPHSPPQDVTAFMNEMNAAGRNWQLVVYGGAMHGFTHKSATGQTPGVLYDPIADARSSVAIQVFLEEALSASQAVVTPEEVQGRWPS